MSTRARVNIRGVVQGVGFRFWTKGEATSRGLSGWVRNLDDGSVEALFEGEETAVKEMIEVSHQGPKYSEVNEVQTEIEEGEAQFEEFLVRFK